MLCDINNLCMLCNHNRIYLNNEVIEMEPGMLKEEFRECWARVRFDEETGSSR